ncbi:MAG: M23 family metallopeptidase [Chromatiaceae bacterium]|jgi:murein DD-endopeptidase MepM/ murein hydrolase activator NlpD|nr:M23 family metallopeptidase [Chromatiaceae bacterium]
MSNLSEQGQAHHHRIWLHALIGSCAVAIVAGAAAWGGYWYGQSQATTTQGLATPLGEMLARERAALQALQEDSTATLDAFGGRLGRMQAELLRVNALGERLVEMAGLSAEEFDFESPPPLGGPEPADAVPSTSAELTEEMNRLFSELRDRDQKLSLIEQLLMERGVREQLLPSSLPVRSGYVTSHFGFRKDPITGRTSAHRGVDFAGKRGTPILAVADGIVIASETRNGYGRTVEIRHGDGLVTRYAHNDKNLVQVGDLVRQGQVIATLGSSGRTTGAHLHFEVLKDGKQVDPLSYVALKSKKDSG